jgi:outer membrane protein assembly factor BamB
MARETLTTDDLLFVAFNSRVIAVDRLDGTEVWRWKARASGAGTSVPILLPDGDRLFVSIGGYTWALDPLDGRVLWHQPFKGDGVGIPSLATMRGVAGSSVAAAAAAAAAASKTQTAG